LNSSAMRISVAQADLDASQLAAFRRDGFLVMRHFLSAADMRDVVRWTDEVVSWPEIPGRHMVYYEDDRNEPGRRVLSRVENFCAYHTGFDALLNDGPVLGMVSALFGERAVLFKDKINFKMPGGDGFKSHQDVQAGGDPYASLHITLLISIDAANEENGCLELVAGAHRGGLLGESWKPLDDAGVPLRYESCRTDSGDAVFFDSYVPHRSAPNRTASPRRVLYVTYNKASEGDCRARYYADKRSSFPPDVEREPGRDYVYRV